VFTNFAFTCCSYSLKTFKVFIHILLVIKIKDLIFIFTNLIIIYSFIICFILYNEYLYFTYFKNLTYF